MTARPVAVISLACGLGFPAQLHNASCGLPKGREINEARRPSWMRGRAIRNLSRFRTISLSSASAVWAARCRPGAEIQNLSESIRLAVFGHVRSCMWIVCRESRAIVHVPRELSLFGCWRGLFGVRRPGTEKFIGWPCLFTGISALPQAAVQMAQENE